MSQKKSRAELKAELDQLKRTRNAGGVVAVLLSAIRWGSLVAMAYLGHLSIVAMAGRMTLADIAVNFSALGKAEVSVPIAVVTAVIAIIYGRRQRKLRKDTIENLQGRIRYLEQQLDPGRTSSSITVRGDTQEEDMP